MSLPADCQPTEDKIVVREKRLASLQEEIRKAAPPQKAAIAERIRDVLGELAELHGELDACLKAHGIDPRPLRSQLSGQCTFLLHWNTDYLYSAPMVLDFEFDAIRTRVTLIFPPIPMPAWLFVTLYGLVELGSGVFGTQVGIAHFAHLGGMVGAFAVLQLWPRRLGSNPG